MVDRGDPADSSKEAEMKAARSDEVAVDSLERGAVGASEDESKSVRMQKESSKKKPLVTEYHKRRNEMDAMLKETPGSDRDCQVTSGQFSDLQQTYYLVEMDMNNNA